MLKAKLLFCLNLVGILSLSIPSFILLSVIDIHFASGQSRTYFCNSQESGYATFARSSRGSRPIIIWRPNTELRCNEISSRFEGASNSGNLRYLLKQGNSICGTDQLDGLCKRYLVYLDSDIDNNSLLIRLFNDRGRVTGSFIFQSNNGEYFDLEQYLNLPLNQQLPENQ